MLRFILGLVALLLVSFALSSPTIACDDEVGCYPAEIVTFHGDRIIKDQIEVKVCHGYWDLLDPGRYNGTLTKWWGPVMVYGDWYGDLPILTSECKTYWVKPGSEIRVFARCVERVITTGRMTHSGTYTLT